MTSGSRSTTPFFLFAFLGTWLLQLPAVGVQMRLVPSTGEGYLGLAALGIFAPLVVATWLTAREGGRAGVKHLYASLLAVKVSPLWSVAALRVPALLLTGGLALFQLAGWHGALVLNRGAAALGVAVVISVAEEVAWRGYALPRLIEHHGAFVGSVILGVLWAFWHVPMFVGLGVPLSLMLVMVLFFVGSSLYFTWLVERTGRSLFIAVLAHLGGHLNNSHAALPSDHVPLLVHTVVLAALGLGVALLDRRVFPELHHRARGWRTSEGERPSPR